MSIFRDVPYRDEEISVYANRAARRLKDVTPKINAGQIVGKPIDVKNDIIDNPPLSMIKERVSLDEMSVVSSKALSFQSNPEFISQRELSFVMQTTKKNTRRKPEVSKETKVVSRVGGDPIEPTFLDPGP